MSDNVNHPAHYGGEDNDYEVIKVLEAWDLELAKGFCWGSLIKYTARAGKKGSEVSDRLKAEWFAHRLATITAALEDKKTPAVERLSPCLDCGWRFCKRGVARCDNCEAKRRMLFDSWMNAFKNGNPDAEALDDHIREDH